MKHFPKREKFEAWLLAMPQDEVVANDWTCTRCPLAWFLLVAGAAQPYVRPDRDYRVSAWRPSDTAKPTRLPKWANDFAGGIDRVGQIRAAKHQAFGPVTAADCLLMLRRIA